MDELTDAERCLIAAARLLEPTGYVLPPERVPLAEELERRGILERLDLHGQRRTRLPRATPGFP